MTEKLLKATKSLTYDCQIIITILDRLLTMAFHEVTTWLCHTKDSKMSCSLLSMCHKWSVWYQNNVTEWSDMSCVCQRNTSEAAL